MSAGLANRRGAEFSARIFSTNFQHADSQCTNFNSNNLRVLSPLVYNIYSVGMYVQDGEIALLESFFCKARVP